MPKTLARIEAIDLVRWDLINDLAERNFGQVRALFEASSTILTQEETNCLFNNLEFLISDFGEDREFTSIL
jgi:hypothetical protein